MGAARSVDLSHPDWASARGSEPSNLTTCASDTRAGRLVTNRSMAPCADSRSPSSSAVPTVARGGTSATAMATPARLESTRRCVTTYPPREACCDGHAEIQQRGQRRRCRRPARASRSASTAAARRSATGRRGRCRGRRRGRRRRSRVRPGSSWPERTALEQAAHRGQRQPPPSSVLGLQRCHGPQRRSHAHVAP